MKPGWRRRWMQRVLSGAAVILWVAAIGGTVGVVCLFPRFLPAANRVRIEAQTDERLRQGPKVPVENLVETQAILLMGAGEAIWALSGLGCVTALAAVVTLVRMQMGHRAAMEEIRGRLEGMERQLKGMGGGKAGPSEESGEPPPVKANGGGRRWILLVAAGGVGCVILGREVQVHYRQRAEEEAWARSDVSLEKAMKEEGGLLIGMVKEGEDFTLPGLRLEMIWVGPGAFQMGDAGADGKRREVTISRGFWLGRYEVLDEQYGVIMHRGLRFKEKRLPAEHMSWFKAMEFCRRLTEVARGGGRLPQGWAFSLPTEAQWEYACRGGTVDEYEKDPEAMAWINHEPVAAFPWFGGPSDVHAYAVGQKKPNGRGFYDMHGNVPEWCVDWYSYPLAGGSVIDPGGPATGEFKVKRGGSVRGTRDCGGTYRVGTSPDHAATEGMRVALVRVE